MAKREIEETEFLANQNLAAMLADVLNNKQAREMFLKAKKIARPNEPIPELDAAAPIQEDLGKLRTEIESLRKASEDAKTERDAAAKTAEFEAAWEKQKTKLKNQYGWLDDGIEKVVALATERGIPDLEAAAALYEKLNPPPAPVEPGGQSRWNLNEMPREDGTDLKRLFDSRGEDNSTLNKMINDTLAEVRGVARR